MEKAAQKWRKERARALIHYTTLGYTTRMATKISMSIPDDELALIDEFSGGNRTAFMVGAALDRARALRRQAIDAEIIQGLTANDFSDLVAELDGLAGDGLDDDALVTSV